MRRQSERVQVVACRGHVAAAARYKQSCYGSHAEDQEIAKVETCYSAILRIGRHRWDGFRAATILTDARSREGNKCPLGHQGQAVTSLDLIQGNDL